MLIVPSSRLPLLAVVAMALPLVAQETELARDVLEMSPSEQHTFVEAALKSEILPSRGDALAMLVINRSSAVIPVLVERIERELRSDAPSELTIAQISELIAYAGDENALLAIDRLVRIDEKRFSGFARRAMTHSSNWHNPFIVAYRALDQGALAVAPHIAQWAKDTAESERMVGLWVEALKQRGSDPPPEDLVSTDPILSRLPQAEAAAVQMHIWSRGFLP